MKNATITLKHKAAQGGGIATRTCVVNQRRAASFSSFSFEKDGIELRKLPTELLEGPLAILRTLPSDTPPDFPATVAARLALEQWLHQAMPQYCKGYMARNVTVRHSSATESMQNRKQLSVQLPVSMFHVDAAHTPLINMWLPVGEHCVTDYQFGFLETEDGHVMTTNGLIQMFASKRGQNKAAAAAAAQKQQQQLSIVALPSTLSWGDVVVFRSGGPDAVVHGSYRFDDTECRTGEDRLSVEFRCQQQQQQQPMDGTLSSNGLVFNAWRYGKDETKAVCTEETKIAGDEAAAMSALNSNAQLLNDVPSNIQSLLHMTSSSPPSPSMSHRFVKSNDLQSRCKAQRPANYSRNFSTRIVEENERLCLERKLPVLSTTLFSIPPSSVTPENHRTTNQGETKTNTISPPSLRCDTTNICVADIDTVSAALVLGSNNNTCILNFANAETPGGYYASNGKAQEEDLCRLCPQLYTSLRSSSYYPIHPYSCLITSNVQVLRVPGTYDLVKEMEKEDPESLGTLTVLTAAMPKCNGKRPKGGWLSVHSEWAIDVRKRVRTVLGAAKCTGKTNLILGAWGCGE